MIRFPLIRRARLDAERHRWLEVFSELRETNIDLRRENIKRARKIDELHLELHDLKRKSGEQS